MPQSLTSKKLHIKENNNLLLLNSIQGFKELLMPLPENVKIHETSGTAMDVVHVFVSNTDELNQFAQIALDALTPEGTLWFAYAKKSSYSDSDITRDQGWDILHKSGYHRVSLISIDATWSSMRFRKSE